VLSGVYFGWEGGQSQVVVKMGPCWEWFNLGEPGTSCFGGGEVWVSEALTANSTEGRKFRNKKRGLKKFEKRGREGQEDQGYQQNFYSPGGGGGGLKRNRPAW